MEIRFLSTLLYSYQFDWSPLLRFALRTEHLYSYHAFEQSEAFKCNNYTVTGSWEKAQLHLHLHPQQVIHHTFSPFDKELESFCQRGHVFCAQILFFRWEERSSESHSCSLASSYIERCVISWPPVHSSRLLRLTLCICFFCTVARSVWHSVSVVHFAVK